ncbi:MAG: DUF4149 domain-containing protein [Paracoccaceae bacterium]
MTTIALLTTALLFGGMTLLSFGFAAFLFAYLPSDSASPLIRKAFPHFYFFVIITSALAGVCLLTPDTMSGLLLLGITVTTSLARQVLMPMINAATDAGQKNNLTCCIPVLWF